MPAGQRHLHRITEHGGRIGVLVLEHLIELLQQRVERRAVRARRREPQPRELHHRFQILRRRAPAHPFAEVGDHGRCGSHLARELLVQVDNRVLAHAAALDHRGRQRRLEQILIGHQAGTTRAPPRHHDLIGGKVGGLHEHRDAVRQRPFGEIERLGLSLAHHASGGRCLRHQRARRHRFHPRRDGGRVNRAEHRADVGIGRHRESVLFRQAHGHHTIGLANAARAQCIHFGHRDGGQQSLHRGILERDPGNGLTLQEVVDVLIHEGFRRRLVALLIRALVATQRIRFGPFQFGRQEPVTTDALGLNQQRLQRLQQPTLFRLCIERVVLTVAHKAATAGTSTDKRRLGFEREFTKPLVQHLIVQTLQQIAAEIPDRARRPALALPQHAYRRAAQLLVGRDRDQRGVVRRNRRDRAGARPLARRNAAERRTDQRLELLRVGITDRHHGHQIGTIPVAPKALERRRVGLLQNLRLADGQPLRVARAAEDHRELLVAQPFASTQSIPPLRQHHATLGHHLGGVEQNAGGHIAQEAKALVENARAVGRNGQDVHRFVEARKRIQVGAKAHADRLEILHDVILREGLRAVERHVLNEVREPALIVVFQNGTRVHNQSQLGPLFRLGVASDVIANAVGQRTDADRRIGWQPRREGKRIGGDGGGGLAGRALRASRTTRHAREERGERHSLNEIHGGLGS